LNFLPSSCILIVRKSVCGEAAMLVISGVFKDNTFIPEKPLDFPDGTRGQFTVDERSIGEAKLAENQGAAVEAFIAGIEAIDEELPPGFDEETAKRLKFQELDFS
jgi:hypothetical protein